MVGWLEGQPIPQPSETDWRTRFDEMFPYRLGENPAVSIPNMDLRKLIKGFISQEIEQVESRAREDENREIEERLGDYFRGLVLMPDPQASLIELKGFLFPKITEKRKLRKNLGDDKIAQAKAEGYKEGYNRGNQDGMRGKFFQKLEIDYEYDIPKELEEYIRAEAKKEVKDVLEALCMMYEQYCSKDGHLFMTAGEFASKVLEDNGLLFPDDAGRGEIKYENLQSLEDK